MSLIKTQSSKYLSSPQNQKSAFMITIFDPCIGINSSRTAGASIWTDYFPKLEFFQWHQEKRRIVRQLRESEVKRRKLSKILGVFIAVFAPAVRSERLCV